MGVSLTEVIRLLLSGKRLSWQGYKNHKAGSLCLDQPEQRRLLEFLLAANPEKVSSGDEALFDGLVAAWENVEHDPAQLNDTDIQRANAQCWLLDRIEASGFGGLTTFEGKPFELHVGGQNWCLEGQNGSGKTSLASAILWGLTGKRIREHEGPIEERGERESVEDEDGTRIGDWPPIAAYPATIPDLQKPAEVWVRLTFVSTNSESAIAYRRMVSPSTGQARLEQQIDARLASTARLAEIGILMPARLSKIGFGKDSATLYEAVKQLTGLDQLSDIADGCTAFGAANRRFMRYAKEKGIERHEVQFSNSIARARELAEEFSIDLPDKLNLGGQELSTSLEGAAKSASQAAGAHFETLKNEIPTSIDLSTVGGRAAIKTAVSDARGLVTQGPKAIALFQIWRSLTEAGANPSFFEISKAIDIAKANLDQALGWHRRQIADGKLRLKALAAQSFVAVDDMDADCPLCESPLNDERKRALSRELTDLKSNSDAAEQRIADACRSIHELLTEKVPAALNGSRTAIDNMNPVDSYAREMRNRFVKDEPFSNVLIGLAEAVDNVVKKQEASLPHFSYPQFSAPDSEPEPAGKLRREIHAIERLVALVDWWKTARHSFADAWNTLVGKKSEDRTVPNESVEGKLSSLEEALNQARPLDELSGNLTQASKAASAWIEIDMVQRTRESIKDALEPLKALRTLVGAETAHSIATLSGRINAVCERIALRERLTFEETVVGRKEVRVTGSFSAGMRIDAALVANTSWLRAILWSFIFALREETLDSLGFNPLPLMVLDDPQMTFDPRNKRKWAQELVRSANLPRSDLRGAQLIVTTHERSFYQMMIDHEKFFAQQGLIGGVNKVSGVATIANGGELRRSFEEAKTLNDDARAREYIRKVRIYCEDLIKFMLRGLGKQIPNMTLNELKEELKKLSKAHVAPFDRRPFDSLVNALNESNKAVQYINDPHHKEDETYGVAEADMVNQYWNKVLLDKIHTAFGVFDTFELYTGEPRTFPWAKNIVTFPTGHKARVKEIELQQTGIAAAAKTDGRAGDGVLTVKEWTTGEKVILPNHDMFQLAAGTLDPIAGVGDLIIVSNYAKINPRNLVVTIAGSALLARRYNKPENHSEIVVLTGQAVDPSAIPEPIIIAPDSEFRKIVGTVFASHLLPSPPIHLEREFIEVPDTTVVEKLLRGARLFKVEGRSAEPIALEGQFLITRDKPIKADAIHSLDGRLVVGIDEDGSRYFKRLRCHSNVVVLESLNPDGSTAAELLSLDGSHSFAKITEALEVVGVLFELPGAGS